MSRTGHCTSQFYFLLLGRETCLEKCTSVGVYAKKRLENGHRMTSALLRSFIFRESADIVGSSNKRNISSAFPMYHL